MRGTYSERFSEAFTYAYKLHGSQRRKGGDLPYVSHLMSVCALVLENGGDEDQAIAALLHDAVEDQGGQATGDEIERRFGKGVRDIVDGCTDTDVIPKPPWRERKERYIEHLRHAPARTRLVSCCDKLHNARTILADVRRDGPAAMDRFTGKTDGTLWYYRALIAAFREAGGLDPLTDELQRVIDDLEAQLTA